MPISEVDEWVHCAARTVCRRIMCGLIVAN